MNRKERIEQKLQDAFQPVELVVEDFSHQHSKGAESHFDVYIISASFDGCTIIKKHRLVYAALQEEMDAGLHALKIQAYGEQEKATDKIPAPRCAGGSQ